MGKRTIKMACGHEEVHNIVGAIKSRDYKASKIAERVCEECAKKERQEHNAICARENKEAGLPELTGSDKQIAWAESIRNEILTEAEKNQELLDALLAGSEITLEDEKIGLMETNAGKIIGLRDEYSYVAKMIKQRIEQL
jgi:hypothetical protein